MCVCVRECVCVFAFVRGGTARRKGKKMSIHAQKLLAVDF